MALAILYKDHGSKRDFQIQNGRIITLIYDDLDHTITFSENGKPIGGEFAFVDKNENGNKYLLQRMYCPIPKSGLGRAALKFFISMTDASIYCTENYGSTSVDGSHLTEDAPGFVNKMQKEGLIIDRLSF